jgi:hypothetical protein
VEQIHTGTYESISFVKDGIVYQVVCLRSGRLHAQGKPDSKKLKIRFKLGGYIQFGCPCSSGRPHEGVVEGGAVQDTPQMQSWDDGKRLGCVSSRYQKRLEMQLFVNDESRSISDAALSSWAQTKGPGRKVEVDATEDVEIFPGTPTIIVATYALRDSLSITPMLTKSSWESIKDHLGISNDSEKMSDRLWTACLTTNYDAGEAVEFCAIATSVEQALCVSSVPVSSPPSDTALETVDRHAPSTVGEHSIALDRGSFPGIGHNDDQDNTGIALVRNIMAGQYVDLQSTLYVPLTLESWSHPKSLHKSVGRSVSLSKSTNFCVHVNLSQTYLIRLDRLMKCVTTT